MKSLHEYQSLYELGFDKNRLYNLIEKDTVNLWIYIKGNPFFNKRVHKLYKNKFISNEMLIYFSKYSEEELKKKKFVLKELPSANFIHEKTILARKDDIEFLIHYNGSRKEVSLYVDNPENEVKDFEGMLVIDDEIFSYDEKWFDNLFTSEGAIVITLKNSMEVPHIVRPGLFVTDKTTYIHNDDIIRLKKSKKTTMIKGKIVQPWQPNAIKIYYELLSGREHLSKEQMASLVRNEMEKRHKNGESGMVKRGAIKPPSGGTILRHAIQNL